MPSFCEANGLKSLIKEPKYDKNPDNPCFIDLIITNNPLSFQNSCVIETGQPDFHETEAVAWRCSIKKVFLEISKNSQEM